MSDVFSQYRKAGDMRSITLELENQTAAASVEHASPVQFADARNSSVTSKQLTLGENSVLAVKRTGSKSQLSYQSGKLKQVLSKLYVSAIKI